VPGVLRALAIVAASLVAVVAVVALAYVVVYAWALVTVAMFFIQLLSAVS
jgi:hypothetical protein